MSGSCFLKATKRVYMALHLPGSRIEPAVYSDKPFYLRYPTFRIWRTPIKSLHRPGSWINPSVLLYQPFHLYPPTSRTRWTLVSTTVMHIRGGRVQDLVVPDRTFSFQRIPVRCSDRAEMCLPFFKSHGQSHISILRRQRSTGHISHLIGRINHLLLVHERYTGRYAIPRIFSDACAYCPFTVFPSKEIWRLFGEDSESRTCSTLTYCSKPSMTGMFLIIVYIISPALCPTEISFPYYETIREKVMM
jgi:hypothetical protein